MIKYYICSQLNEQHFVYLHVFETNSMIIVTVMSKH